MRTVRIVVIAWATAAGLGAHGLVLDWRSAGEAVVVHARFDDDGHPAANADISVYRQGEGEAFASGTTDPNGLFAFVPDAAGRWTAVVDDGFGHRETLDVEPRLDGSLPPEAEAPVSRWRDLITGLAILFGATGIWMARRGSSDG